MLLHLTRVHLNYLEVLCIFVLFSLFAGLYQPVAAAVFTFLFLFARILFQFYVKPQGASHPFRVAGAVLGDVAILGNFILAILCSFKWMCVY